MYTLHKHIGSYEHFRVGIVKYGAVVAHAFDSRFVLCLYVIGEMMDQSELTEF